VAPPERGPSVLVLAIEAGDALGLDPVLAFGLADLLLVDELSVPIRAARFGLGAALLRTENVELEAYSHRHALRQACGQGRCAPARVGIGEDCTGGALCPLS
jgi:hypothetical protein